MQTKSDWAAHIFSLRSKITAGVMLMLLATLFIVMIFASDVSRLTTTWQTRERWHSAAVHLALLEGLLDEASAELRNGAGGRGLSSQFAAHGKITQEVSLIRELLSNESLHHPALEQLRLQTEGPRWRKMLAGSDLASNGEIRTALEELRTQIDKLALANQQIIDQSRSEVDGLASRVLLRAALLFVMLAAAATIACRRFAYHLTDPVSQMIVATERLMLGEIAPRVDESHRDELGELAAFFNRTAQCVAEREQDFRQQNRELDELREFNSLLQTSNGEREVHQALFQKLSRLEISQALILDRCSEEPGLMIVDSMYPFAVTDNSYPDSTSLPDAPLCRVARSSREMVIADVTTDFLCTECRFGQQHGSSYCVPVMANSRTLGTLHLMSPHREYWTAERQRLVRALVDHAAPVINNLRLLKTLEDRTITDEQTKVYNRRFLDDYLQKQIGLARRYSTPLSVMMMDIDHFKKFNDTYGHEAGDLVLKYFARAIASSLREGELVARYGGEEFTIVMQGDIKAAMTLAERLRRAVIALSFPQLGENVRVTMSVGIAEFPTNGQTPEDVLKAADFALYCAKDAGRNCIKVASRSLMAIKAGR